MKRSMIAIGVIGMMFGPWGNALVPEGYQGKPFEDSVYHGGPQTIPGRLQCAYFDLGGEGVAYHGDGINHGSGELNQKPDHQRPHATPYFWNFRKDEGVSVSYTKDFADFNHPGPVPFTPETNQLYVGWTKDGQWVNYTVNVKTPGTYKIVALYANNATTVTFSLNHKVASQCKLPVPTGGFHTWNRAEIGEITFPEAGLQLLTFNYGVGNNFAYFDFVPEPPPTH